MNWKKVEYSKNRVKAAGNAIAKNDYTKISKEESLSVINNWRAAHAFPLQVFYVNCRNKAKRYTNAIAVQRLKRLDSIVGKLQRTSDMSLTRMQDLGGCRIIMDSIEDVYTVVEEFKGSRIRHKLVREYDYIENPKISGYRSIHLVYSYDSDKKTDYNSMFIEVQIRTQLQHLWATAIEVLGLYTRHNLKASQGDERMLRYMELVSALFAIEEGTIVNYQGVCYDNLNVKENILFELSSLTDTNVVSILSATTLALQNHDRHTSKTKEGYYLLAIDYSKKILFHKYFHKSAIGTATAEYERIERNNINNQINAVLVSAADMDTIRKAYPNYFADVKSFVNKLIELVE